jgi:hypothetical protein
LANIDVGAADAYFNVSCAASKHKVGSLKSMLIKSVEKYVDQLGLTKDERVSTESSWIDFSPPVVVGGTGVVNTAPGLNSAPALMNSAPVLIKFNEQTGVQLNKQLEFPAPVSKAKAGNASIKLPWKEWCASGGAVGSLESDKSAAVALLHAIHDNFNLQDQPIDVYQKLKDGVQLKGEYSVVTNEYVYTNVILLPACVPKQSKVHERTEHPHAVQMTVSVLKRVGDAEKSTTQRTRTIWLIPEFQAPRLNDVKPAVADDVDDAPAVAEGGDATAAVAVVDDWVWNEHGDDTMHPFWAVRRLTEKMLLKEKAEIEAKPLGHGVPIPRYNCEIHTMTLSNTNIGLADKKLLNQTRLFEAPFLTNIIPLEKGEELILKISEKLDKKKPEKKRNWRDAANDADKADKAKDSAERSDARKAARASKAG